MSKFPTQSVYRTQDQEVSLLPRHWEWLGGQPRSASATLRLLVERARRDESGEYAAQDAKDRCYFYMRDKAGDLPYFEEASRALFAGNAALFDATLAHWPGEIQEEARALAASVWRVAVHDGQQNRRGS